MPQKRTNIRLTEHCEMLRAIKLYFEENSMNLSRYILCLIKYYLITGEFFNAGKINLTPYLTMIKEPSTMALYIDIDDMVFKEWLDNHNSREIAKQTRFILNNSFSTAEHSEIVPFEDVHNACELLMVQKKSKPMQTLAPSNEKLDKLISLLEKIDSDELDKLLDMLGEKTDKQEYDVENATEEANTPETEEDALERTQKTLANINFLM